MINHSSIVAYFKYLSDNLIGVNDFFRADLTELMGAFRSTAKFPCLVLESHENDLGESSIMENVNDRNFAFTIFTKPKRGNYDDQNDKLTLSEELGFKIIARMRHDATIQGHLIHRAFKVESVKAFKVGPVSNEELYGYRFTGTFVKARSLKVDATDWKDNPTICS